MGGGWRGGADDASVRCHTWCLARGEGEGQSADFDISTATGVLRTCMVVINIPPIRLIIGFDVNEPFLLTSPASEGKSDSSRILF